MVPHLREHRGRITAGFVCILLTNGFMLAAPWVTKYAVDSLTESVTRQKLAYYGVLIIALAILRSTFQFFMRRLIIGVSRDIEYTFRNDLFAHLEKLPVSFYQRNKTGELMSRATNDLSNVRMPGWTGDHVHGQYPHDCYVCGGAHDEDRLATHAACARAPAGRFVHHPVFWKKDS